MHVISRRPIRDFVQEHPHAEASLTAWWRVANHKNWRHLEDVRQSWKTAEAVGSLTVFNISGNKYRLITFIDYEAQVILVRRILTHADYDQGAWKNDPYYQSR
jgi:mRNA interferase HigB